METALLSHPFATISPVPFVDPEAKKAHGRAYYLANRDRLRANMAEYRVANSERISEQRKAKREADRDEKNAARRERYRDDAAYRERILVAQREAGFEPGQATARFAAWSKANPEAAKQAKLNWKVNNRERMLEAERVRRRRRYAADPESERAASRLRRSLNPDKVLAYVQARRALLACVEYEPINRRVLWERDEGICHICGLAADQSNWHMDHIYPLSKGGPHLYSNVAVSHPVCNIRKRDKV